MTRPTEVISFIDAGNDLVGTSQSFIGVNTPGLYTAPEGVQYIHAKRANAVYIDGHVQQNKEKEIQYGNFIAY